MNDMFILGQIATRECGLVGAVGRAMTNSEVAACAVAWVWRQDGVWFDGLPI
jgi:hypothetical protein